MAYKTLMTIITAPDAHSATLDTAIAMARQNDGHLDILAMGVDRTQTGYYYAGANAMVLQETIEQAEADAAAVEDAVNARMKNEDIKWACEKAVTQLASVGRLVGHRARFSDLVVVPKPYGKGVSADLELIVEAAMFEGHAPALVVPGKQPAGPPKRVVVAWNESAEALTAVRAALPLLKAAESVNIAIIDPPQHGPERSDPGGALSQMLARHGVRPEVSVLAKTMPRVSDVLARHCTDQNADLLVMGAYGHSRFREAILGGATRNLLEHAEIPVFMAH